MPELAGSVGVGMSGLLAAAVVALYLTIARRPIHARVTPLRTARLTAAFAAVVHLAHFTEESFTGFHTRFPKLLGLESWPFPLFATLNLTMLAIFAVSAAAISPGRRAPLLPLWFLGIAGVMNAGAHPLLSLRVSGYFPGLYTSPLAGLAGLLLLRSLARVTSSDQSKLRAPDSI